MDKQTKTLRELLLSRKKDIPIKGLIHIGAHLCEEREVYDELNIKNVLWIEANGEVIEEATRILASAESAPHHKIIQACLSDTNGKTPFYITQYKRDSSLLKPTGHARVVKDFSTTTIEVTRFDTLTSEKRIDLSNYNVLVVDVQGAELKVFHGFGDLISKFDSILLEMWIHQSDRYYTNLVLSKGIIDYLASKEFVLTKRIPDLDEHSRKKDEPEWVDALFEKQCGEEE